MAIPVKLLVFSAIACVVSAPAAIAQGVITTFAGTDWVFPGDGKPAIDAPLGQLGGITIDPAGNPVFVDAANCIVARINPDGTLSVIAGNGICVESGENGPATSAAIQDPQDVTYDNNGNLYILTYTKIKKVSPSGILTTVAGGGSSTSDGGSALQAKIRSDGGIVVDTIGNIIFADGSDGSTHRVRKITFDGIISTIAGNGTPGFSGDTGAATAASLSHPRGVALDQAGSLFIADTNNNRIRKVTNGTISTFISGIGLPLPVGPVSVVFDRSGSLYIADYFKIYRVARGSTLATPIASPNSGSSRGLSVTVDASSMLYVADALNSRVSKIGADGIIIRTAGNGRYKYGGEQTPALATTLAFNGFPDLALDRAGNLYVSEDAGNRVRKIGSGIVTTYAGTGDPKNIGDGGPANQAGLTGPRGLAFDSLGNLLIATTFGIRRVTPNGVISTVNSLSTLTSSCHRILPDMAGNLYLSCFDNVVRRLDSSRNLTPFAGNGNPGFSGDMGPATSAQLNFPVGLAWDKDGNLLIADTTNNRIRKVTSQGIISTIAGPSLLQGPFALLPDQSGNLLVAESFRVRKVSPNGSITTIAGGGPPGALGDGKVATSATLNNPSGLAMDVAGNLYIAESGTGRIRVVLASPPTVQVPETYLPVFLSAPSGGAPTTQTIPVLGSIAGLEFGVSAATFDTGSWLTVDTANGATPRLLQVTADPTGLSPGRTYNGTITITPAAALPTKIIFRVSFQVGDAQPPKLVVDKPNLSFTFPQGASKRSISVTISNAGGGTLNFSASASKVAISPSSGQALPGKPVSISITADPSGLATGTYTDTVQIQSDSAGNISIPVNITVSDLPEALLLTQTGLSFTAVAKGGVIPTQSFGVVNLGIGVLNWTAATATLPAGLSWLSVTPDSGTSDAAQAAPQVTVNVNANGLDPGVYYGLITISAPGAANTPQVVTVFLEVLQAGSDPGAMVQPSELVFFATPTSGPPSSKALQVFNIGANPKTVRTDHSGPFPFLAVPNEGVLDPGRPLRLIIQPTGTFAKGTYTGALTLQFSDGRVQTVKLTVIWSDSLPGPSNALQAKRAATGCTPTKLVPSITTLSQSFSVSAGWPVALAADVHDDCGNPHTSGSVSVSFSNGDPPLPLSSLQDGTWQATWQTRSNAALSNVSLTVDAVNPQLNITGSRQIAGALRSPKDPPVLTSGSVGSAAGFVAFSALAPGGIISIYGDRLADSTASSQDLPLRTQLSNTQVIIAGQTIPLFYVSQTQINALVPFGLNPNTRHQVVVQRGLTVSQPVFVDVGPAQPAAFVDSSSNAIAMAFRGTAPSFRVTPTTPATAGDVLVISCAGLGPTDQSVGDGAPSPSSPPAQVKAPVVVSIGGKGAIVQFSGLTPGFVGLYQVNAVVPDGITPGNAQLTFTVAGQTGPQSILAIQ